MSLFHSIKCRFIILNNNRNTYVFIPETLFWMILTCLNKNKHCQYCRHEKKTNRIQKNCCICLVLKWYNYQVSISLYHLVVRIFNHFVRVWYRWINDNWSFGSFWLSKRKMRINHFVDLNDHFFVYIFTELWIKYLFFSTKKIEYIK